MADSDSESEAEEGFEYDDGSSDDSRSSDPEVLGIGISCKKDFTLPDGEIKDEIKSEPPTDNDKESSEEDEKASSSEEDEEDKKLNEIVDDEEAKRTEIRKELSTLTYEELDALKHKLGIKMYNEAMFGGGSSGGKSSRSKNRRKVFKRDNPNRPRELPSRVHVPKVREVIHVKKDAVKRDPRFEESCGELDQNMWEKNYEFLKDIQKDEAKELKKSLETETDEEKKYKIIKYLQTLKNKERSDAVKEKEIQKRREQKQENVKRLKEGKNPFYLKKSTRKYVDLVEKYDELKASGGLDKYLTKKRTKNAKRDKKTLKIAKHSV